jgi:hypothetical protein
VDKAHVEHAVGLVENETFDFAQSERIVFNKIKQPARRGNKNIDAIKQRTNLPTHRYAADRQRGSGGRGLTARRCRIGSAKAAVLPVPVWAIPITSRPDMTVGIVCAWIGVGVW